MTVGDKVKMLTIVGRPTGTITKEFMWAAGYDSLFWVRLEDGTLLKDVIWPEFTVIKKSKKGK